MFTSQLATWRFKFAILIGFVFFVSSESHTCQPFMVGLMSWGYNCSEKGLTNVPTDIQGETKIMMLDKNNIQEIKRYSFRMMVGLREIILARNSIHTIEKESFSKLLNLEELILSYNQITKLDFNIPMSLRILSLNFNSINLANAENIGNFKKSNLKEIWLQNSNLHNVPVEILPPQIETISLVDNSLKEIRLADLKKFKSLTSIVITQKEFKQTATYKDSKCYDLLAWCDIRNIRYCNVLKCSPPKSKGVISKKAIPKKKSAPSQPAKKKNT